MSRMEQIGQALDMLAAGDPQAVAEAFARVGARDPEALIRVELALRLLAADEQDRPFWAAVLGGYRKGENNSDDRGA